MVTEMRLGRLLDVVAKRQPDLHVVLENVKDPHNISAILRSCDAVGVQYVHIIHASGAVGISQRVSGGSAQWLDILIYHDSSELIPVLLNREIKIYVTTIDPGGKDFRNADYTLPCAIVVGNEKEGISPEILKIAHECITIPMMGFVQSLNVSVAAALVLYEAFTQRERAGMYGTPRLELHERMRLLERWQNLK